VRELGFSLGTMQPMPSFVVTSVVIELFGRGMIRADGRKVHPMYLMELKTPAESKGP
jgi:hypothetical protein